MHKLKSISKSVYKHEDWHHIYSNTTHVYNINQFILFCVSVCFFLLCALQFVVACCATALHASSYRSLTASSKLKQCPLQLVKLVRHSRRSRSLEVTLTHACLAYTAQHPSTSTSSNNNNSSQHVHKAQHKIEPSQHKPFTQVCTLAQLVMQQLLVIAKDASALCSLRVAQRSSHSLALLFEDCFYSCFLAALVSPISFHSGFAGSALLSRLAFDAPFTVVQPRLFRLLLLLFVVVCWLAVCVLL
jgi:hypothetical protein